MISEQGSGSQTCLWVNSSRGAGAVGGGEDPPPLPSPQPQVPAGIPRSLPAGTNTGTNILTLLGGGLVQKNNNNDGKEEKPCRRSWQHVMGSAGTPVPIAGV